MVTQLKILGKDGVVGTISQDSPLPVVLVDAGIVAGAIGSFGATVAVKPTVTAGAYSANDCVGGVLTFAGCARENGSGGVLKNVVIVDDARQQGQIELWLFDRTFTSPGDNAAWVLGELDAENLVAVVTTNDGIWFDGGGAGSDACDIEASKRYVCNATSLFGQLVCRGTPTYAATDDVTVKLGLLLD